MASAGLKLHLEPRYLFQSVIPPALLTEPRRPPGIIPDAAGEATLLPLASARGAPRPTGPPLTRVYLFDIKTVHAGCNYYFCPRARDDQSGAVAQRANEVNGTAEGGEYGRHARRLDRQMARDHGVVGTPIADRLALLGPVRGLAFGNYAEASPDVHALIELVASALARAHWRSSGARNEAEAKGVWVACCRRRVGVAVARAYARFRLRRAIFVGVPRAVLDDGARRAAWRRWRRPPMAWRRTRRSTCTRSTRSR